MTFSGTAFTETGLIAGDAITGVTASSAGAAAEAAVGTYSIVPGAATGTGLANYDITYTNGLPTVRPLVVVPVPQTAHEDVAKAIGGISLNGCAGAALTVTLGVGHGTLTLGATTRLTVAGNGNVNASGSVAITVVSSAQQATALSTQVNALNAAGVLTAKQANILLTNLSLQGNRRDVGKIGSFLNNVAGYRKSGALTTVQADALSTAGNVLLLSVARR